MSDPTIYENLKVAFENHLYDLDNLEERIRIQKRSDLMDFADLSRRLTLRFVRTDVPEVPAEVMLTASAKDLSDEILEVPGTEPGVTLGVRFDVKVIDAARQCEEIGRLLAELWEYDIRISQTLSFEYPHGGKGWTNRVEAEFRTRLDESHMTEIGGFLESVVDAMGRLSEIR